MFILSKSWYFGTSPELGISASHNFHKFVTFTLRFSEKLSLKLYWNCIPNRGPIQNFMYWGPIQNCIYWGPIQNFIYWGPIQICILITLGRFLLNIFKQLSRPLQVDTNPELDYGLIQSMDQSRKWTNSEEGPVQKMD